MTVHDQGDTTTIAETVTTTAEELEAVPDRRAHGDHDEVVADKGYHSSGGSRDTRPADLYRPIAAGATGRTRRRRATRCTRIVDASGACVGWPCRSTE